MHRVGTSGSRPQFLGNVRARGGQHQQQRLNGLLPRLGAAYGCFFGLEQGVVQFHQVGDVGVEAELFHVFRALADRLVDLAPQVS